MRLIDADVFKTEVAGATIRLNLPVERMVALISLIDNQPTVGQQDNWIPVSERLPKNDGFYLVSYPPYHKQYKKEKIDNAIEYCYLENEKFFIIADGLHAKNECWKEELTSVIAWKELPEPYKPEKEEPCT